MGYITQHHPPACTVKDSFASLALSGEHTPNSTNLPHNSVPDPLGDSLAPLSHPKGFGEEHSRSARLLPYFTRKHILFTLHVLGAGVHNTSSRTLQLIDDLQPIPGPFCNVPREPSIMKVNAVSSHLKTPSRCFYVLTC